MIKLNKTTSRHCRRMLGVLTLLFGFCIPTWAEVYPGRPVTLVVPFPPGGVADTVGRPIAESMAQFLGQPIVIDNKAGAGGGIGMAQVARSKPERSGCRRIGVRADSRHYPMCPVSKSSV